MTSPAPSQHQATPAQQPVNAISSSAAARATTAQPIAQVLGSPKRFLMLLGVLTAVGVSGVIYGNTTFAPEMYSDAGPVEMGTAMAKGKNVALFDLNFNIREMRDAHIAQMQSVPDVVVLGASHWQEADASLLPNKAYYNAHVHRDYYEDMLGVTEMFYRHGKLPRQMIISIRDNLFTDVKDRKDHLWLPGAPYARMMSERLALEPLGHWDTKPVQRWREMLSLQMLYGNVSRWYLASEKPHATDSRYFTGLDTLLPDGSIVWSRQHQQLFTADRAKNLSISFADQNMNAPPPLDAKGIEAIDTLLAFLKRKNVEVFLTHPPFNPIYFDRVRNTPYMEGLRKIEEVTASFGKKYGLRTIGGFDPAKLGCTSDMFIDAEHANSDCLRSIFKQFIALDRANQPDASNVSQAPQLLLPTRDTVVAALDAAQSFDTNERLSNAPRPLKIPGEVLVANTPETSVAAAAPAWRTVVKITPTSPRRMTRAPRRVANHRNGR
jgi:hypothetical protein